MSKRFFESLEKADARARRNRRATARRAVWAILQDPVVNFNMVNDLEKRVERAVIVAEKTKSPSTAIALAGLLAKKEEENEAIERLREISKCVACNEARNRVGYPGMPSSYRYCEDHR